MEAKPEEKHSAVTVVKQFTGGGLLETELHLQG